MCEYCAVEDFCNCFCEALELDGDDLVFCRSCKHYNISVEPEAYGFDDDAEPLWTAGEEA